jgi:hypothetical protein
MGQIAEEMMIHSYPSSWSTTGSDESIERASNCFLSRLMFPLMIPPNSVRDFAWEFFGVLCIIYDVVWIPVYCMEPPPSASSEVASWIVRVYWTVNVFVRFVMGYLDHKGTQVISPLLVADNYIKTWFFFDVGIMIIDWLDVCVDDSIGAGTSFIGKASRLLVVVRLFRVLRLRHLWHFVKDIRNERISLSLTIGKIILVLITITHMVACMWYGIGNYGNLSTSWVKHEGLTHLPLGERYVWSFHCAISLLTGEHVVLPRSPAERAFCIVVLFVAILISTWLVSSLTTAMTRLHIIASQKASQLSSLKRYLSDNKISRELATKVQRNAKFMLKEQKRNAPENSIELLSLISDPLRSELHFEVYAPILLVHPFFKGYSEIQVTALHKICHNAITRLMFSTGDVVFTEGETPVVPRMYLTAKGHLEYQRQAQSLGANKAIGKGEWVSEAVLWTDWSHMGTMKAGIDAQLLALDAVKFQNIAAKFPCVTIRSYAKHFVSSLSSMAPSELTDVGSLDAYLDIVSKAASFAIGERASMAGGRGSYAFNAGASLARGSFARRTSMETLQQGTLQAIRRMSGGLSERCSMSPERRTSQVAPKTMWSLPQWWRQKVEDPELDDSPVPSVASLPSLPFTVQMTPDSTCS